MADDRIAQIEAVMLRYRCARLKWEAREIAALPPTEAFSDARAEIIRIMREDFDPTPPNWEGREWDDNAEDAAAKIIAVALSEKPTHISDAWAVVKKWLTAYAEEEATFSRYRDHVVLDGVMTAVEMRKLNTALAFQCCKGLAPEAECGCLRSASTAKRPPTEAEVEAAAKRIADDDLWPGAFDQASEPERNIWRQHARAALTPEPAHE